jgi:hypothetical protein
MKLIGVSKVYHVFIFCTFFLPFLTNSCENTKDKAIEQAKKDSLKADSISKVINQPIKTDSIAKREINKKTVSNVGKMNLDSLSKKKPEKKSKIKNFVENIIFDNVLSFLCKDKNSNLTGFGIIVLGLSIYLKEIGIINSFLLILLSIFLIFRKNRRFLKSVLIVDIFGFLFLLAAHADLWGYWICLWSWLGLLVLDAAEVYMQKSVK